jgi:hypothetical protein
MQLTKIHNSISNFIYLTKFLEGVFVIDITAVGTDTVVDYVVAAAACVVGEQPTAFLAFVSRKH